MDLNELKKIYFLGIGGIGMSALAKLFRHEGKEVLGSDTGFSDRTGLVKLGVGAYEGYDASHITEDVDALVYTLAISPDNAELARARELGMKILSYAEMLGEVSKNKNTIAICGTHGKTTTTAMIAHTMIKSGLNPSVIVGSLMTNPSDPNDRNNYIHGDSNYLVTESCEYQKSFLNINPKIICITNIDADHLDFYGSIENIVLAFKDFVKKLPEDGVVIADLEDSNSREVTENCGKKVINWRSFLDKDLKLYVPGNHNRENAAVALALAHYLEIPLNDAKRALTTFTGTWRRFEYKGNTLNGAKVYDDYAHHPHEILATLGGAREEFPGKKITVVFEPHLYSRTKEHFESFGEVLTKFDTVYLTDIYAAREKFDGSISSGLLVEEIKKKNPNVFYISKFEDIAKSIKEKATSDEIIITMGAGTIGELSEMLVK